MIKLIALVSMLIDHIGLVLLTEVHILRIIGRISMPLFAYCVARGFYYSRQHGTDKRYIAYMLAFALVSQLPYSFMVNGSLNIGFTWLLALLLLKASSLKYRTVFARALMQGLLTGAVFVLVQLKLLPVDYGIYGVITPLLFYLLILNKRENTMAYALALLIGWAVYVLIVQRTPGSLIQVVSVLVAPILTVSKEFDGKVRLPKWVFYSFYPLHITALLVLRYLI